MLECKELKYSHRNDVNRRCHPSFVKEIATAKHHLPFNPLTPMNDQDRISPYNINIISRRQVMKIKKNIN